MIRLYIDEEGDRKIIIKNRVKNMIEKVWSGSLES